MQAQEQTELLQKKNKEEEDAYKVKKRTVDLLPDASNNIVKLEVCSVNWLYTIFCKQLSFVYRSGDNTIGPGKFFWSAKTKKENNFKRIEKHV